MLTSWCQNQSAELQHFKCKEIFAYALLNLQLFFHFICLLSFCESTIHSSQQIRLQGKLLYFFNLRRGNLCKFLFHGKFISKNYLRKTLSSRNVLVRFAWTTRKIETCVFNCEHRPFCSEIKNLRTFFERELAKKKIANKSGAGRNEKCDSKWPHF